MIVSPECRRLRCLPAEQFVDQLMKVWEEPYYLGLLSAAERHGAAHQRPQSCQRRLAGAGAVARRRAGRAGPHRQPGDRRAVPGPGDRKQPRLPRGTALYKLYIDPPARYSEVIDLVQARPEPIGDTLDRARAVLDQRLVALLAGEPWKGAEDAAAPKPPRRT